MCNKYLRIPLLNPLCTFLLLLSFAQMNCLAQLSLLYPNDIGIEIDPNVMYVEKFDDGLANILSRYTDIQNSNGMSLESDVPAGSLDPYCIRMTNIGGTNNGGHLFKKFTPGWDDKIYLRYYVKYPEISNGFIHHESVWLGGYNPATNWPNPQAGTCGLGDSRISVCYEPIQEPNMNTYLYWGDMQSWNNGASCYGNDMGNNSPTSQDLPWDEWMCVEVMIKLNNPVTEYNGELQVWQNGVEVGHWGPGYPNGHWLVDSWQNVTTDPAFQGFRWRTSENLNINYVWIEYYDDTSPAGEDHYIQYDHLVIASEYIGPIYDAANSINPSSTDLKTSVKFNPLSRSVEIFNSGLAQSFELFSSEGKLMYQTMLSSGNQVLKLDMPDGIYFYAIYEDKFGRSCGKISLVTY